MFFFRCSKIYKLSTTGALCNLPFFSIMSALYVQLYFMFPLIDTKFYNFKLKMTDYILMYTELNSFLLNSIKTKLNSGKNPKSKKTEKEQMVTNFRS